MLLRERHSRPEAADAQGAALSLHRLKGVLHVHGVQSGDHCVQSQAAPCQQIAGAHPQPHKNVRCTCAHRRHAESGERVCARLKLRLSVRCWNMGSRARACTPAEWPRLLTRGQRLLTRGQWGQWGTGACKSTSSAAAASQSAICRQVPRPTLAIARLPVQLPAGRP